MSKTIKRQVSWLQIVR